MRESMLDLELIFRILFFLHGLSSFVINADSDGHCIDTTQHIISQGLYYVPGPNPCTFCLCDKGNPKWCKPVYCKQPQNCKSFHTGENCCDFVCLDDILKQNTNNTFKDSYKDTYDLALRFIASSVFIILTLTLMFFVVHRFRRHKMRVRQNGRLNDEQRSLNSIGYLAGSLGYLPGNISYLESGSNNLDFHYENSNSHFALWKPPGRYFPRGEAPPPYDEAVRTAQLETNFTQPSGSNTSTQSNRSTSIPGPCRHQHLTRNHNTQEYANVTIETVLLPQTETNNNLQGATGTSQPKIVKASDKCKRYENVILRQNEQPSTSTSKLNQKFIQDNAKKYENVILKDSTCTKGLLNTLRNLEKTSRENEITYENIEPCYENMRHRVVPNQDKKDKNRNSIYFLTENCPRRDLNKLNIKRQDNQIKDLKLTKNSYEIPLHRTLPKHLKELMTNVEKKTETDFYKHRSLPKQYINPDTILSVNLIKQEGAGPSSSQMDLKEKKKYEDQRTFLSYQCLSSQDDDDYRSECENCKSTDINVENEETDVFNETMTLQRRPEASEEVPYYRNSLTLPSQIKKPKTTTPNANREGWFTSMQETSSSDESD